MRNIILGAPRLVRDDPVHPPSTSADDLLQRTHAKPATAVLSASQHARGGGDASAGAGLQRCASAEGSAGWVTQEEHLAHRHSTKRLRALPNFPKLMSSWDVDDDRQRVETDASSGAPYHDQHSRHLGIRPGASGVDERGSRPDASGTQAPMDATYSQFSPLSSDTSSAAFTPTSSSLRASSWSATSGLPWREAGPPNHHDDKVDSDQ